MIGGAVLNPHKPATEKPSTETPQRPSRLPTAAAAQHDKKYHHCDCYGHPLGLPNYKVLAQPRTNNYYNATGGCPCIPRSAAHPGSWRNKREQLRSTANHFPFGCTKKRPGTTCCVHAGETYGWLPGPHKVLAKNCAASGLCDTFGNMAFKKPIRSQDKDSDVSSVTTQKLAKLEELILREHGERRRIEMDVDELEDIKKRGAENDYKVDYENEKKRKQAMAASEGQLKELLREVRGIVNRPLNQTNIDILRGIVDRQEQFMQLRSLRAHEDFPPIIHP
ncbi:uncharacterized protein TEOVI_000201200 [Trypanosoma equiperdum]|uniref:Uncharacterized protein n=4 Tax=Trypanozoon TaxID=39700 RepID=Q583F4_TRYB2|nr:hypothetical protein, conserved [Trypanosoma brucei gambiense DAL972]XP_844618.1 hypothetical protein, conserved [Trypanosoma brucei brucei TREU927]AAX80501.1 hypothetical protein, conserved [Trypanosoma brucei]RHW73008.1 hypothetical protein DPX39_040077600 [Trypanosoma brucei equiperdum]SCU70439.1 hypothetical protein, conserved [Trypanosoma equiperdum]AAZ11059.1 hypothetical protein, conserved [Trypanosoma brucei brucei TREU927]CBH10788.1 hypothetical protein, conserved [Trypanosoma bru|eukprot:XP_011773076.1 hypothetical protein, conserved [Trypanosoma brucei gambiense DAL972]